MSYSPMGRGFVELTTSAMDANVSGVHTSALDISEASSVIIFVQERTGAHTAHEITLQCSPNDVDWDNTTTVVTAGRTVIDNVSISSNFVRGFISLVEGGASDVNVIIQAK